MSGTYIEARLHDESVSVIAAIARRIVNILGHGTPIEDEDIHMTVLYSSYPEKPKCEEFQIEEGWECSINGVDLFGPNSDILVARINCPDAVELNKECIKAGATYTFKEYKPHLTLVYNVDPLVLKKNKAKILKMLKDRQVYVKTVEVKELIQGWQDKYEKDEETASDKFSKSKKAPQWKGYEMLGLKMQGKKLVPDCIKAESARLEPLRQTIISRLDFS